MVTRFDLKLELKIVC